MEELHHDIITNAAKTFVNDMRDTEVKGGVVHINDINVIDNVLAHSWGRLLREERGRATAKSPIIKVKTLEDVRAVGEADVCITQSD